MSAQHMKFIQRIFWLMQECGMPDKTPDRTLLDELYVMIEEHCEDWGVDLE